MTNINVYERIYFDDLSEMFFGEVQGVKIQEVAYYSPLAFIDYNFSEMHDRELFAIADDFLQTAFTTMNEITSMEDDDEDKPYWEQDYENEMDSYLSLADELQARGVDCPNTLDLFDNFSVFKNLEEGLRMELHLYAPIRKER